MIIGWFILKHGGFSMRPNWWHGHGIKMAVGKLDLEEHTLHLNGGGGVISFKITRRGLLNGAGWCVLWALRHEPESESFGSRVFNSAELRAAFHLVEETSPPSRLALRFDADVAVQGKFIRCGQFLNIPGPGTGHDGDVNISIFVEDTIKEAVSRLIQE